MDVRAAPLAEIFRLNGWLFHNCLDGLSDEQARARPSPATNSAAFVAAHVADTRFTLVGWLGAPIENPLAGALAAATGIDDVARMPTLAEVRLAWDTVSATLAERLDAATAEGLDAPAGQRFPVDDRTILGALAFLAQHDSYHVGQLALLRKHAGLPAMRYAPRRPASRS